MQDIPGVLLNENGPLLSSKWRRYLAMILICVCCLGLNAVFLSSVYSVCDLSRCRFRYGKKEFGGKFFGVFVIKNGG